MTTAPAVPSAEDSARASREASVEASIDAKVAAAHAAASKTSTPTTSATPGQIPGTVSARTRTSTPTTTMTTTPTASRTRKPHRSATPSPSRTATERDLDFVGELPLVDPADAADWVAAGHAVCTGIARGTSANAQYARIKDGAGSGFARKFITASIKYYCPGADAVTDPGYTGDPQFNIGPIS